MSGELVGLVIDHGPDDHHDWAVLTVIAEDLRGVSKSCVLSNDEIARSARLHRDTVKRAVARLVADGWISRVAGRHRGVASTYRLRLDRFPSEAVDDLLERGAHSTPVENERGAHSTPMSEKGVLPATERGADSTPLPSVSTSVPPRDVADSEDVAMLLPFDGGREEETPINSDDGDDWWSVVLADVPQSSRPRKRNGLREIATSNRWTASQIADALRDEQHDYSRARGGAVFESLSEIVARRAPAAPPPVDTSPPCSICGRGERACRRVPFAISQHDYSPPGRDDVVVDEAPRREERSNGEPRRPDFSTRLASSEPFKSRRRSG